jgi:hypothetical protein
MAYSKLHSSIVNSSLWVERDATRLLFITLLALCDRDGIVYGSRTGLARIANIHAEEIEEAWACLMSPDPDSGDRVRAPENEGRRIEEVSGGYKLLNFEYYRGLRNDDDRREQNRAAQAKHKAKVSQGKPEKAEESPAKPPKAHTETDTEAETDAFSEQPSTAFTAGGAPPAPPQAPSTGLASGKQPRKRVSKPATPKPSAAVWTAYAEAYKERYSVDPVRNAKVNAQIAKLVGRLGADEAPGVARAYIANRNGLYVAAKHCVDLLLRDAEKLRTEWATGNVTHQRDASEQDRLASTGAMWDRVGERLKAKGIE